MQTGLVGFRLLVLRTIRTALTCLEARHPLPLGSGRGALRRGWDAGEPGSEGEGEEGFETLRVGLGLDLRGQARDGGLQEFFDGFDEYAGRLHGPPLWLIPLGLELTDCSDRSIRSILGCARKMVGFWTDSPGEGVFVWDEGTWPREAQVEDCA